MDQVLSDWIARHEQVAFDPAMLGNANSETGCVLTADEPPDQFVATGRAIVRRGEEVLVLTEAQGRHFIPGGQREPDEAPVDAMTRIVKLETGLAVRPLRQVAILVCHNVTPEPTPLPTGWIWPDWLQVVFQAEIVGDPPASEPMAGASVEFVELDQLERKSVSPVEKSLLRQLLSEPVER